MKKSTALFFGIGLVSLLSLGSGVVIGQTTKEIPRITTACETKIGGILFGVNDGYSTLKNCPQKTRKVILGEKAESSDNDEVKLNYTNIVFGGDYVLAKNGTVWKYNILDAPSLGLTKGWREFTDNKLPEGITADKVQIWDGSNGEYFVTKSGDLYNLFRNNEGISTWMKMEDVSL